MNWLSLALFTVFFYAIFDLFVKLSSDKLHSSTGGLIINVFAALVLLIFTVFSYFTGEKITDIKQGGFMYSAIAGIMVGLASIFFIKMFATGTNLSVGVPIVRVGTVILASVIGIILLKEGVSVKYIGGMLLSVFGLYLVATSK